MDEKIVKDSQCLAKDLVNDCISRKAAIDALNEYFDRIGRLKRKGLNKGEKAIRLDVVGTIDSIPSAQQETEKYEYHYDHTDCIWYRPEARNRCPVTCAQYRDGWNDAMNYIFRGGKGYRPYRRDEQYGE